MEWVESVIYSQLNFSLLILEGGFVNWFEKHLAI